METSKSVLIVQMGVKLVNLSINVLIVKMDTKKLIISALILALQTKYLNLLGDQDKPSAFYVMNLVKVAKMR